MSVGVGPADAGHRAEPPADEEQCEDRPDDDVVVANRLRLLTGGPERLEALLALIGGARQSLRLLYYIYSGDEAGRAVREALIDALDRGVTVSMIIDGFGSDASDEFLQPLIDAGAETCRFIPRFGRRYLLRNHQKLAIADGETAIIGGFNVSDDYFGTAADDAWRDIGLFIDGPTIAHLSGYFDALSAWTHQPKARIADLRRALEEHSDPEGRVRWVFGGPTRGLSPWAKAVKRDLASARRLDLIAAYFAPNPAMLARIRRVAREGGEARVLTAAKSDNSATIAAARHCYRRLLKFGVRIYEYLPTKLHTKLLVIDGVSYVGSANFDMRSLYINLELMLRIEDEPFAARCRAYFQGELERSEEITRALLRRRAGWFTRLRWTFAYFLVAVLDFNVSRRLNFGLDGE